MASALPNRKPDEDQGTVSPYVSEVRVAGDDLQAREPSACTYPPFRGIAFGPTERPKPVAREKAYTLCALVFLGDWMAACAAILTGLVFRDLQRAGWNLHAEAVLDLRSSPLIWSLVGGTLFVWLMAGFHTYELLNLFRLRRWTANLIRSVAIWSMVVWAIIGLFKLTGYAPRLGVVYCAATLIGFSTLWRLVSFVFLVQPEIKGAATSRILVVGWNEKVTQLWRVMKRDMAQMREIVGSVPMPEGTFAARPPAEVAVLGDYFDLPKLASDCQINTIILSEVNSPAVDIQGLIRYCQREMIAFQMVPEYFPVLTSGLQVQTLSGVPLLGVCELPLDRTVNRMIKRLTDIIGSMFGLLVSVVVVPPLALGVFLESPGPIFLRQSRTTRGGRSFNVWRIRTTKMQRSCDSYESHLEQSESGTLKTGRLMQLFYLNELPRFWSVLVGDMSLVGPAPERVETTSRLKTEIPHHNARHEVRPGLTGWAQIQNLHRSSDSSRMTAADLYYMENWSPLLDLYCLMVTLLKTRTIAD